MNNKGAVDEFNSDTHTHTKIDCQKLLPAVCGWMMRSGSVHGVIVSASGRGTINLSAYSNSINVRALVVPLMVYGFVSPGDKHGLCVF